MMQALVGTWRDAYKDRQECAKALEDAQTSLSLAEQHLDAVRRDGQFELLLAATQQVDDRRNACTKRRDRRERAGRLLERVEGELLTEIRHQNRIHGNWRRLETLISGEAERTGDNSYYCAFCQAAPSYRGELRPGHVFHMCHLCYPQADARLSTLTDIYRRNLAMPTGAAYLLILDRLDVSDLASLVAAYARGV